MNTMLFARLSSPRSASKNSSPVIRGILRSSTINAGCGIFSCPCSPRSMSSPCWPSLATKTGLTIRCCLNPRWMARTSTSSSSTIMMLTVSLNTVLTLRATLSFGTPGPREAEFRPSPLDDLLDEREAHAAPLDGVARLERREHPEDLVVVVLRNSGPVVLHDEFDVVAVSASEDLNPPVGAVVMLDRVADQVPQHLMQGCAMGQERRQGLDRDREPRRQRQRLDNFTRQLLAIDVAQIPVAPADAGIFEHVVEQCLHPLHAALHQVQIVADLLGEFGRMILGDPAGDLGNRPQRGTQVVRGGIGEIVELPIAPLQLRRVAANLLLGRLPLADVADEGAELVVVPDPQRRDRQLDRELDTQLAEGRQLQPPAEQGSF